MSVEIGATGGIDFGYLPQVCRLSRRSFSVWINKTAAPVGTSDAVMGPFADGAGVLISITTSRQVQYYSVQTVNIGIWKTPVNSVPLNAWTHIVVTMDLGDGHTNDPVIYIDGVAQSLTEATTPSGAIKLNNEVGANFVVGGIHTATANYTGALDGKIHNPMVYSRILTQAEVTTIYNAGRNPLDWTVIPHDENLQFEGLFVRTDRMHLYVVDQVVPERLKFRDGVFNVLGTPHGVTIRDP